MAGDAAVHCHFTRDACVTSNPGNLLLEASLEAWLQLSEQAVQERLVDGLHAPLGGAARGCKPHEQSGNGRKSEHEGQATPHGRPLPGIVVSSLVMVRRAILRRPACAILLC